MLRTYGIAVTIAGQQRESVNMGYCASHDIEYKLNNDDDVCPKCLKELNQSLAWRDSMDKVRE